jgi:2,4-dienoyl-CoA reductase-like NADH-dependent reductase (Old Yellow Enzyme family)
VALDRAAIDAAIESFAQAARRARHAGFQILEVHAAHGYLLHSFLSPVSTRRTDEYGGSLENRARLLLRTIDAVRTQWPEDLPLFVRLSCTDWVEGGWDIASSVQLARILQATGQVDLIDCSSGGGDARAVVRPFPGYQIRFAERIKREVGIATAAVGLIHSPDMAEHVVASGAADLVVLGRTLLGDPYWPLQAAKHLRTAIRWPYQYERGDIF